MVFFDSTLKNTVCSINLAILSNVEVITIPVTNYSISILARLVDLGVLRSFKLLDTQTSTSTAILHKAYCNRTFVFGLFYILVVAYLYSYNFFRLLTHPVVFILLLLCLYVMYLFLVLLFGRTFFRNLQYLQ